MENRTTAPLKQPKKSPLAKHIGQQSPSSQKLNRWLKCLERAFLAAIAGLFIVAIFVSIRGSVYGAATVRLWWLVFAAAAATLAALLVFHALLLRITAGLLMPDSLKLISRREITRFRTLKFRIQYGAHVYKRISVADAASFSRVLSAWRPAGEKPAVILRWVVSYWCNYNCPYCPQKHERSRLERHLFMGGGKFHTHAFDNHPVEKWLEAFQRHFQDRRLSLVIEGGEPMIDYKNMPPLLRELTNMPTTECVRIDTNLSWDPEKYRGIDASKVILMCTYHPSQVSKESFYRRVRQVQDFGIKIGMVNFVMTRPNLEIYRQTSEEMAALGVPLHPNPLWNSRGKYSKEDLSLLKAELPDADYAYRSGALSPYGKKCLFPALAYRMNQNGQLSVGCHSHLSGNFFDGSLIPLMPGSVPCPMNSCCSLDMYSFLEEVNRNTSANPLHIYSDILKQKRGIKN